MACDHFQDIHFQDMHIEGQALVLNHRGHDRGWIGKSKREEEGGRRRARTGHYPEDARDASILVCQSPGLFPFGL